MCFVQNVLNEMIELRYLTKTFLTKKKKSMFIQKRVKPKTQCLCYDHYACTKKT